MGEIKSTLDLVMERTQNMSLSDEEKARQQRDEYEKRLQGLLQKYADGGYGLDRLQAEIGRLQQSMRFNDQTALRNAVRRRIEPDGNPGRWLDLMARLAPEISRSLADILKTYRTRRDECIETAERRLRRRLIQAHGIAGSAVSPNPRKDRRCRDDLSALRREAEDRLTAAVCE